VNDHYNLLLIISSPREAEGEQKPTNQAVEHNPYSNYSVVVKEGKD
jgi:hypothetical protein